MIILSTDDVAELLPMGEAIEIVSAAMVEVAEGKTTLPLRSIIPVGDGNFMGMMPGVMQDPACYGIKLVSLFPNNPKFGFSSHQGAMVMFEAKYGAAIAMMNSDLLTAIRTSAASGVATRSLAREDSTKLAIIGTGEQAQHHIDAMVEVRPISDVVIAGRSLDAADKLAVKSRQKYGKINITTTTDIRQAVSDADIVCTVTAADEPLLFGNWIKPGTHLNIVGSSIPSKREIDTELVVRSKLFVDYRISTMAQAGEVILAIEENKITADHILAEIGEVIAGTSTGRQSDDEITLYRSLGVAAQDLAAAYYVVEQAKKRSMGTEVTL
jgi:alanine dehydrogenase